LRQRGKTVKRYTCTSGLLLYSSAEVSLNGSVCLLLVFWSVTIARSQQARSTRESDHRGPGDETQQCVSLLPWQRGKPSRSRPVCSSLCRAHTSKQKFVSSSASATEKTAINNTELYPAIGARGKIGCIFTNFHFHFCPNFSVVHPYQLELFLAHACL